MKVYVIKVEEGNIFHYEEAYLTKATAIEVAYYSMINDPNNAKYFVEEIEVVQK